MKKILLLLMLFSTTMVYAQDVIVKNDGSTIICRVSEVGTSEVKYKKFSNLDGPLYSISVDDVQNINFENGEKENFEDKNNSFDSQTSTNKNLFLNYGTEIPIQVVSPVRARDVSEGQEVSFRTISNTFVDGINLIPAGTPVKGIVYKAKRSSPFGTKGKLGIRIDHLTLSDGTQIPLNGDVYVTGHNRTALSVLLFLFVTWPACFICGTKAELTPGYGAMASIGSSIEFTRSGKAIISKPIIDSPSTENELTLIQDKNSKESSNNALESIPPLPCNASLIYKNSVLERVQIIKVNPKSGYITYKKLNYNGEVKKTKYNISIKKLQRIEFNKESSQEKVDEANQ
jgi:hypothetical protein